MLRAVHLKFEASSRLRERDEGRGVREVRSPMRTPQPLDRSAFSIKSREIVLPEEHDNKHAFEHAWKELLTKTQTAENLIICDTNVYDADMFAATWRPIIATLNYVFVSATEDAVFQRVVAGYNQCAQIAARYGASECLDHIILSLAKISTGRVGS